MHTCIPSLLDLLHTLPHLNGFSVGESKWDSKEELQALLFLPDIYTDEVKLKSSPREVLACVRVCVFVPNEDVQPQNEVWGDGGGPTAWPWGQMGLGLNM